MRTLLLVSLFLAASGCATGPSQVSDERSAWISDNTTLLWGLFSVGTLNYCISNWDESAGKAAPVCYKPSYEKPASVPPPKPTSAPSPKPTSPAPKAPKSDFHSD